MVPKRLNQRGALHMHHVAILAYGSLIEDPGQEILAEVVRRIQNVQTPFRVEFAHSSKRRDAAPTLIPVQEGGSQVRAVILVLSEKVTLDHAESMLWRRETNRVGSLETYTRPHTPGPNTVIVDRLHEFHGMKTVLYTRIAENISPLTPERLAELAIDSVRGTASAQARDGISYLMAVKRNGIETPLMKEYEREILNAVPANTLEEARRALRASFAKDRK